ncbi:MAG: peptide ABC transporter substrate-binding protein [Gammaproteobacteria bacterium]|nr:peptide ABC transporter substrate-binding protein [Gammaproteobacteria bacterium]MCP5423586.1 peptide ABC transporter substrate-binding protein [Gammaproteobacteria bacterium]MCP5459830.1 peptide ABC transporter substrate-binding protein [Gammaproteobacteria bacterium]
MLAKVYVLGMTQRPITAYNHDWQLVCMLCTEPPSLENGKATLEKLPNGKQGIAVTYTLQPQATWGDGTPITTKDVLFTLEVGREPKAGVTAQELYRRILKIDVQDDKTFTVHWDRVTFEYASLGDFRLLPEHLERPIFAADPAQYRNRTNFDTNPTLPGLYFGPYRITQVERGAYLVLEPNPTWWGPAPQFKRIVIRTIENTAALEANLLSGEIDMIAGELGLSLDQALAFEKRHGDAFKVIYKPGLGYEHLNFNLDNPLFKDIDVRKALLLGIDRKAISRELFDDKQPVADTNVNPLDWVYDPSAPHVVYDPVQAGALLDKAGWDVIKNGMRENSNGERLGFDLMTTAGNRSRELVQQVLQSQWRELGIDVRIRNEPARVFFGQTVTQRQFTGLAMFAWISSPESVPRSTLHSQEIPTVENGWSGQNVGGYRNPEMDKLIDAIEVELDRDKRKALWSKLQHLYAQDLPVIPLFFRAEAYILPPWLEGLRPTGHQFPSTLWVEEWRSTE